MEPSAHKRSENEYRMVIICPYRLIREDKPSQLSQIRSLADVVPASGDDVFNLNPQGESVVLLFIGDQTEVDPVAGVVGFRRSTPGQPLIVIVDDLESKLVSGLLASGSKGYQFCFK